MKAVVLSSGGVDSTTCVSEAIYEHGRENVVTVSFFYGQKHSKELEAAEAVAEYYGIPHYILHISEIFRYSNCSLLDGSTEEIKHESYAEQIAKNGEGMVSTYVPFRNGLMISAAASLAMSLFPEEDSLIYLGAHADDAAGHAYPDCSVEFTETMAAAIWHGTYGRVRVATPFVDYNKANVVKRGLELETPYHLTWSCYEGKEKPCGECGTCIDRIAAFEANGVTDPLMEE